MIRMHIHDISSIVMIEFAYFRSAYLHAILIRGVCINGTQLGIIFNIFCANIQLYQHD